MWRKIGSLTRLAKSEAFASSRPNLLESAGLLYLLLPLLYLLLPLLVSSLQSEGTQMAVQHAAAMHLALASLFEQVQRVSQEGRTFTGAVAAAPLEKQAELFT